jgi:hypothetical protein
MTDQTYRLVALCSKDRSPYCDPFLEPWLEKHKEVIRVVDVCEDGGYIEAFVPVLTLKDAELETRIGGVSSQANFDDESKRYRAQGSTIVDGKKLLQFEAELIQALGSEGRVHVSTKVEQEAGRIEIEIIGPGSAEAGSILGFINRAFLDSWTGRWPNCQVEVKSDSLRMDFFYWEKFWMTGELAGASSLFGAWFR